MGNQENMEAQLADSLQRAIRNVMRNSLIVDGVIINTDSAETQYVCDVQLTASDGQPVFKSVPLRVLIGAGASFVEIPELNLILTTSRMIFGLASDFDESIDIEYSGSETAEYVKSLNGSAKIPFLNLFKPFALVTVKFCVVC